MKLERLPSQFIYTDRRTLDDFLREDDLNKELYKVFLRVKDRPYYFKFSTESAFNEAWYIATMAMNESHPELNVREWWYIAKRDIGWAYAANLVMSMVFTLLSLQEDKTDAIDYVLEKMKSANYGEEHFPDFKEHVEKCERRFNSNFELCPYPVDELREMPISWKDVSNDFEQEDIRELVALFPSQEEQLKLIDLIELRQNEMIPPAPSIPEDALPF